MDPLRTALDQFVFKPIDLLFEHARHGEELHGVAIALLLTDVMDILGKRCPEKTRTNGERCGAVERFVLSCVSHDDEPLAAWLNELRHSLHHNLSLESIAKRMRYTLMNSPAVDRHHDDESLSICLSNLFEQVKGGARFFFDHVQPSTPMDDQRPRPPVLQEKDYGHRGIESHTTGTPPPTIL